MVLEYTSDVDSKALLAARKTIEAELARLRSERETLDAEIAKREQFLQATDALFPVEQRPAPASLEDIPKNGYGAMTRAVKTILAQNAATTRQLTQTLHRAGFLKDPNDPTPVRTVIKGLRKRGVEVLHDPATGAYRLP